MGHRRFLPMSQRFREDEVSINSSKEWECAPPKLSGTDMRKKLDGILTEYKKDDLIKRNMVRLTREIRRKKYFL